MWIVDPLDGTTNYVYSLPLSVVSICVTHNEMPVIGVVYHPYLDEMYTAIKGHGSQLNGKPIHVRSDATLHESVVGYAHELHGAHSSCDDAGRFSSGRLRA